jgi:hypothetical protein
VLQARPAEQLVEACDAEASRTEEDDDPVAATVSRARKQKIVATSSSGTTNPSRISAIVCWSLSGNAPICMHESSSPPLITASRPSGSGEAIGRRVMRVLPITLLVPPLVEVTARRYPRRVAG